MFELRDQHLEAFRQAVADTFVENALDHLRHQLRRKTGSYSDDELRQRIRECVVRARTYDLKTRIQVLCFLDTTYLVGNDFDVRPDTRWASDVLNNSELDAEFRARLLLASAREYDRAMMSTKRT